MGIEKSFDEMWQAIQPWYEERYPGFKFTQRISNQKIVWLYDEMIKFKETEARYREGGAKALRALCNQSPRLISISSLHQSY